MVSEPASLPNVGGYAGMLQRLGHRPWFARVGRALVPVDRALQRVSRGRIGGIGPQVLPELLLTATGRTSGLPRQVPLLYARDGPNIVVVASNWGQATHPAWSANLLAEPAATVDIRGKPVAVQARLASAQEKARVWPLVLKVWPAYETYAERSGRELRVFILEPATTHG
jgi:deazaflavin-dependent oxidoreductase (nitroreductase family)